MAYTVIICLTVVISVWMVLGFCRRVLVYSMIYKVLMKWGYPPEHFDADQFVEEVFTASEVHREFQQERTLQ